MVIVVQFSVKPLLTNFGQFFLGIKRSFSLKLFGWKTVRLNHENGNSVSGSRKQFNCSSELTGQGWGQNQSYMPGSGFRNRLAQYRILEIQGNRGGTGKSRQNSRGTRKSQYGQCRSFYDSSVDCYYRGWCGASKESRFWQHWIILTQFELWLLLVASYKYYAYMLYIPKFLYDLHEYLRFSPQLVFIMNFFLRAMTKEKTLLRFLT